MYSSLNKAKNKPFFVVNCKQFRACNTKLEILPTKIKKHNVQYRTSQDDHNEDFITCKNIKGRSRKEKQSHFGPKLAIHQGE